MLRSPAGSRHRLLPRRGTPPAPLAARGSHSNAEVEQGKALTADVPEVEAFDNLGGDKKGERFQTALGTMCIRRGGSIQLHAPYQRDQGIWQQTLPATINQAPN